jgi:AcrR family transcriptional regulator
MSVPSRLVASTVQKRLAWPAVTVSEPATTSVSTDGRTARAQRTRLAVVDALLALIEEGDLRPTGPRIAERAGVSLRSVFQHYNDLESLFAAAGDRQLERIAGVVSPIDASLPLDERVRAFADQRGRVLELLTPSRRAAFVQEPFSAQLRASRDKMLALARAEVQQVFATELAGLPGPTANQVVAAIDAVASWGAWDALRSTSDLSPEASAEVVGRLIAALLADVASSNQT